jgi:hypothetical protein
MTSRGGAKVLSLKFNQDRSKYTADNLHLRRNVEQPFVIVASSFIFKSQAASLAALMLAYVFTTSSP